MCLGFSFNSISNYFSGQGCSVCMCMYGGLSVNNWKEDNKSHVGVHMPVVSATGEKGVRACCVGVSVNVCRH